MQMNIASEAMRKRPEYTGASADVRAGMEKDLRAGFHSAIIQRALDADDSKYAKTYFDSIQGDLPLASRTKLEKLIKPATDFAEGKSLALEVMDKIKAGEMSVSEGERHIIEKAGSKESASVAQSVMREMQDAQRREADKVTGTLVEKFEMRPGHGTMNSIMASPEFRNMEPEKRANLVKYMRSEIEQADDRYRARRNEQYRSPETYEKFMSVLEDPKFATMSREEIFAKRMDLGPELTTRLLAEHKNITNETKRFQIDKDLIEAAIPDSVRKDKTKSAVFKGIVESELSQWKINNPGKLPSLEEQRAITRSANAEYIEVGKVWNSSTTRYQAEGKSNAVPKEFYDNMKKRGAKDDEIIQAWAIKQGSR
jgi:hypothetical protein